MKLGLALTLLFFPLLLLSQQWEADFDAALKRSKQERKSLVLVFSGSDWCAPCKKLDRDIWQSAAFQDYAAQHFVLYKADFPRRKKNQLSEPQLKANKELAEIYNPQGYFPLVVLMNPNAEVYGTLGYEKATPDEYLALMNSFVR